MSAAADLMTMMQAAAYEYRERYRRPGPASILLPAWYLDYAASVEFDVQAHADEIARAWGFDGAHITRLDEIEVDE